MMQQREHPGAYRLPSGQDFALVGKKVVRLLTEHVELERLAGALTLRVGGVTSVAAGGVPGNALQNEARLAHDDPRAHVVLQHVAL